MLTQVTAEGPRPSRAPLLGICESLGAVFGLGGVTTALDIYVWNLLFPCEFIISLEIFYLSRDISYVGKGAVSAHA